jgi:hypothetical protein
MQSHHPIPCKISEALLHQPKLKKHPSSFSPKHHVVEYKARVHLLLHVMGLLR